MLARVLLDQRSAHREHSYDETTSDARQNRDAK
jgi:hypothetical protein